MYISILIPTRNRNHRLQEFFRSVVDTAQHLHQLEILLYVDEDDTGTREQELINEFPQLSLKFFRKPHDIIQGNRYNFLMSQASADIFMYAADDIVFESKYWDKKVYSEFTRYQDRIVLVYPPATKYKCGLAAHGFVSRRSTEVLGRLFTPYFCSVSDDVWLTKVYTAVNRAVCFSKISVRHKHRMFHPELDDDTYRNAKKICDRDSVVFKAHEHEILDDIRKLKQAIQ